MNQKLATYRGIYVLFLEQSTIFIMSPSLIDLTLKSMKLKLFYFYCKTWFHQIQVANQLKLKIVYHQLTPNWKVGPLLDQLQYFKVREWEWLGVTLEINPLEIVFGSVKHWFQWLFSQSVNH